MEQVDAVRYVSMPQNVFVGDFARYYDASCSGERQSDPAFIEEVVTVLADLTAGGAALELGIGTGRVAVPLREHGVDVHGIEISEDMIAEVHKKPGGGDIPITLGDFATTRAEGDFTLVYAVYHTLGCLLTQAEQVACFRNAAAHLEPGGAFLVEFGVPQLRRMQLGETAYLSSMNEDYVQFETYDFVEQRIVSTEHWYLGERIAKSDLHYRYAWPSELDLMAELAGLRLRDRWSDWSRAPFTNESEDHISVWEKP
jgi:SAM-dependent methyltransferase